MTSDFYTKHMLPAKPEGQGFVKPWRQTAVLCDPGLACHPFQSADAAFELILMFSSHRKG